MYLIEFIKLAKSLVVIYIMSQKFGFACNDSDTSRVRPGRKNRANSECINRGKSVLRSHPETAAGCDEIYCGQCGKYLKNQLRKYLFAGEVLDF